MSVVTEDELCSFIKSEFLKLKLAEKDIHDEIEELRASDKNNRWDTPAKRVIGKKMDMWFKEYFGSRTLGDRWDNCFAHEGDEGPYQNIKRTKVFSSSCYPDMCFLKPVKIAIELDHGNKGSALKNALTKASFENLSGDWSRVYVIFFDESNGKKIKKKLDDAMSKKILKFYQEHLNTEIVII